MASSDVSDPVFATPATFPGGAPKTGEKNNWRGFLIFFGPAAILLLVFLVFPTIYTILLAFNRGRRGEFTNWVGLDNFTTLFTNDPNFINLSTFPPSGAVWNNVLWIIFYTGFVLGLGLLIATLAIRVRYESIIKAAVFLPQAIAATALAVIWKFVYAPDANIGLLNAGLGIVGVGPDLVPGRPEHRQLGPHRGRDLGLGRLRDRHPVGGPQGHPDRDHRGGPHRRRQRAPDLLPDHPADGQPAVVGPGGDPHRQRGQAVRPDLRA